MKTFLTRLATAFATLKNTYSTSEDITSVLTYLIYEVDAAKQALGAAPGASVDTNVIIGLSEAEKTALETHLRTGSEVGDFKLAVAYVLKNAIAPYYIVDVGRIRLGVTNITEAQVVDYINTKYDSIVQDATIPPETRPTQTNIQVYKSLFGADGSIASIIRNTSTDTNSINSISGNVPQ